MAFFNKSILEETTSWKKVGEPAPVVRKSQNLTPREESVFKLAAELKNLVRRDQNERARKKKD
jgi:hypothetical protein